MQPSPNVEKYWTRQHQWSLLADRINAQIAFARLATLSLTVVGALLQTLAAGLAPSIASNIIAVVSAIALILVPFFSKHSLSADRVQQWLRSRSVSEGLKSLVFRYLGKCEPFTGDEAARRFSDACRDTEGYFTEVADQLALIEAPAREVPAIGSPGDYIQLRVFGQINGYYRPKARMNAKRAAAFRVLEIGASVVAALVGSVAGALRLATLDLGVVGAWVAVLTTIGTAFAAHSAANRYQMQARTYFATARELEDAVADWKATDSSDEAFWSKTVKRCEDAISAENRGWMAKLDPEEGKRISS